MASRCLGSSDSRSGAYLGPVAAVMFSVPVVRTSSVRLGAVASIAMEDTSSLILSGGQAPKILRTFPAVIFPDFIFVFE